MLWTALTGANYYQKHYLIQWEFNTREKTYAIPDFNATSLMTAKTKSEQLQRYEQAPKYKNLANQYRKKPLTDQSKPYIIDHIFAVIGHYKGNVTISDGIIIKPIEYNLIQLFDPWQIDFDDSDNYFNDNSEFWESSEVKKRIPFTKDENDGKFFVSFEDFVNNFDILFQMEVNYMKKPISFQIPLSNLENNTVNLEFDFSLTNDSFEYEVYWDILVGNNNRVQIEPFSIVGYQITHDITLENRVYQGLKLKTNQISLQVFRFNEDIIDTMSFVIYAPQNQTIRLNNKSKYLTGCENNCNQHGICQDGICNCTIPGVLIFIVVFD